jgi:hypothetical protein
VSKVEESRVLVPPRGSHDHWLIVRWAHAAREGSSMKKLIGNAAAAVAAGMKEAAADPLAVVAANPVRALVHRHATANPSLAGLNAFLRSELAAVGTLSMLAERLEVYPFQDQLRELLASHEARTAKLREAIAKAGTPASAQEWRVRGEIFAARLALMMSERKALALLHGREQLALRVYRGEHPQLDEQARRLVVYDLLPEQERTAALMASLARKL